MSVTLTLPEGVVSEALAARLIPALKATIISDDTRKNVLHICCKPEEESDVITKLRTMGVPDEIIDLDVR